MNRPLPVNTDEWVKEIDDAFGDAREAKPYGRLIGERIIDADLFHMAPLVCLKFRGLRLSKKERDEVIKTSLANYVVNTEPGSLADGTPVQGVPELKTNPKLAFALCYVSAHLALGMLEEEAAEQILHHYEAHCPRRHRV